MSAQPRKKLSKSERRTVMALYEMAEQNMCSCHKPGDGKGFHGHDKSCHVHIARDTFKAADKMLGLEAQP